MEHARKKQTQKKDEPTKTPFWIILIHILFLVWVVIHEKYPVVFIGAFLLFLGFYRATRPFQEELSLKSPILVGCFLAGLVIHGSLQGWWIAPLLSDMSHEALLLMSTVLTAFNDNAQITFLATLVPNFDENMKYMLMAGAVSGGGLTVIANAPNPSGQAILGRFFGHGIPMLSLFLGALLPTIIMLCCFYFIT